MDGSKSVQHVFTSSTKEEVREFYVKEGFFLFSKGR
jgi:hypothetical protein